MVRRRAARPRSEPTKPATELTLRDLYDPDEPLPDYVDTSTPEHNWSARAARAHRRLSERKNR